MGLFNKSENWWLRLTLVVLVIAFLSLYAKINKEVSLLVKSKDSQIQNLSNLNDSLNQELFIEKNNLGRYDLALDSFNIVNPKAKLEFDKILNSGQYE